MAIPLLHAATSNPGKLREFARAAAATGLSVQPLPGLATLPEPDETAHTFAGNADLKAVAYSLAAPGLLVFADDSGLEIDALGGRPGVLSARFADTLGFLAPASTAEPLAPAAAPPLPRDERNLRCVLALLAEVDRASAHRAPHSARFVCALSLARDGDVLLRTEGTVSGEILPSPRGTDGFGYDPLFLLRDRGLTLAELAPDEKSAVSHRGHAFRALLAALPTAGL